MSTTTAAPMPDDDAPSVSEGYIVPSTNAAAAARAQMVFDDVLRRAAGGLVPSSAPLIGVAADCVAPAPGTNAAAALAAFWLDEPEPPRVRAMRAAATLHRRRNIAWNVEEDDPTFVPDLTAHAWLDGCMVRSGPVVVLAGHQRRHFVCTRRAHHTGRHAAGSFGRIVAVWSSR